MAPASTRPACPYPRWIPATSSVTACLAALDLGETVCIPGLDDPAAIEHYHNAARQLLQASGPALASRYQTTAALGHHEQASVPLTLRDHGRGRAARTKSVTASSLKEPPVGGQVLRLACCLGDQPGPRADALPLEGLFGTITLVQQVRPFIDDRLSAFCYACDGTPTVRSLVRSSRPGPAYARSHEPLACWRRGCRGIPATTTPRPGGPGVALFRTSLTSQGVR
jgi:hypothetical protein